VLDATGFIVDVSAGFVGLVIGVFATYFIVDSLVKRQEMEQKRPVVREIVAVRLLRFLFFFLELEEIRTHALVSEYALKEQIVKREGTIASHCQEIDAIVGAYGRMIPDDILHSLTRLENALEGLRLLKVVESRDETIELGINVAVGVFLELTEKLNLADLIDEKGYEIYEKFRRQIEEIRKKQEEYKKGKGSLKS